MGFGGSGSPQNRTKCILSCLITRIVIWLQNLGKPKTPKNSWWLNFEPALPTTVSIEVLSLKVKLCWDSHGHVITLCVSKKKACQLCVVVFFVCFLHK